MSEHHELCQLRIDGLKDTIATLTARLQAAKDGGDHFAVRLIGAEQTIASLTAQRDAAEAQADMLNEAINGWMALCTKTEAQRDAAEKVCEAAERVKTAKALRDDDDPMFSLQHLFHVCDDLAAEVTDWRRTKDG